jgi:hypothetical protein
MTAANKERLTTEAKLYFLDQLNAQHARARAKRARAFEYLDQHREELESYWADLTLRIEDIKAKYKGTVTGSQLDAYLQVRLGYTPEMRQLRSKKVCSARAEIRRKTQKSALTRKTEQETVSPLSRKLLAMQWTRSGSGAS